MDLLQKIKDRRKELKLTQKEVAKKISSILPISQAAYAKIESGKTSSISIEYGKCIAKALEISFNELFEIETPYNKRLAELENEKRELENEIIQLKEQLDDKKTIIKFLKENDFTLDIAAKISFLENGREFTDFDDPDWLEKFISNRKYDPGDKQSQIRYIEEWFDNLEKSKKD